MKIKLYCYYGENGPGDVIDTDAKEGERLIDVGAGVEVEAKSKPEPANKARAVAPENK